MGFGCLRLFRVLLIPLLCLASGHCADASLIARGKYLAIAGDCVVCHTRSQVGSPSFAGGYPLHAPPGTVYSANITPDKRTGIGNWSASEFYRAMHDGISADGRHLYPAFPYIYFSKLSRADSDAIFAYLRTIKPVHYRPPRNRLIFPMDIRGAMAFWNALYLKPEPLPKGRSSAWNRGAEIVLGIGHCGACHTPKNILYADKQSEYLQGNFIDGWFASNLTGARPDGLGNWTAADIELYLKTGQNHFSRVAGAMRDVVQASTSLMTDADRAAIATYLKSLPPSVSPPPSTPNAQAMSAGQTLFVSRCSVCHALNGAGNVNYPSLSRNTLIVARNPDTVLRVILQGSQSIKTPRGRFGFSMPAFPVLSSRELADVTTYIRNSWGNTAGPVTAKQVKAFRKLLTSGD
jgi:mono/diheme cytochrome c family protein